MESPSDRILTASSFSAAAGAAETVPTASEESPVTAAMSAASPFFSVYICSIPFYHFRRKYGGFFTRFLSFPLFLVYAHSTKKSIPSEKFYNSTVLFTKESYTLFIKNCSFYTKMAESEKIPPKCYFLEKREIICFLQVLRFADFVP